MDYEKKYNEALERAKELFSSKRSVLVKKQTLESIFPELKESEDEKIRAFLIDFIKVCGWSEKQFPPREDCIAWLERQGGQKPSDKPEPRFKVGDWVTNNIETVQITGYDIDYGYQVNYKGDLQHRDTDIIKKEYHLWTILDAKDGDVLYSLDSKQPFIYKERPQYSQARGYCCINKFGEFALWNTSKCVIGTDKYIPATWKQRDLLFSKMKESGYKWDAEKKELRKIEQKPTDAEIKESMDAVTNFKVFAADLAKTFNITHKRDIDWHNFCAGLLTYLERNKPAEWSEEDNIGWDEAFACVTRAEKAAKNEEELQNAVTAEKWLKEIKFKYCVHPVKQEWSEEGERIRTKLLSYFNGFEESTSFGSREVIEIRHWLKSLRPQPKQEWSKEIEAFNAAYKAGYDVGFRDGRNSVSYPYWPPYTPPYQPITTPVEPYFGYRVTCTTTTSDNVQTNNEEHHEEEK